MHDCSSCVRVAQHPRITSPDDGWVRHTSEATGYREVCPAKAEERAT